jgi:hypothetical protein
MHVPRAVREYHVGRELHFPEKLFPTLPGAGLDTCHEDHVAYDDGYDVLPASSGI